MSSPLGVSPRLVQVAIVVRDLEKALERFTALLGTGHTPIKESPPRASSRMEYRGTPSEARVRMAFFTVGDGVRLEVMQPIDDEPSVWKEHLDKYGEGLHHVAFEVPDMGRSVLSFKDLGVPMIQSGEFPGGGYSYVDTLRDLHFRIELLGFDGGRT